MSLRSGKKYSSMDAPPRSHHSKENVNIQQDDLKSHASRSSSKFSSASSLAIKARAKADAARVHLAFAEKEASLKKEMAEKDASRRNEIAERDKEMAERDKERAEREAELQLLQCQRAAAAAEAEAAAYLQANPSESERTCEGPEVPEKPLSSAERTSEFIHSLFNKPEPAAMAKPEPSATVKPEPAAVVSTPRHFYSTNNVKPATEHQSEDPKDRNPRFSLPHQRDCAPEQQCIQDITKYLLRKETVNSSFIKFDDCPENYWAWKSSFQNATKDLNLSASEMLDLMIKYLGDESAEHAKSMRRVNLFNPLTGLHMAWQRLERQYGAPEVIEKALMNRLDAFPKLSNRDTKRLQDLGDLLLEIECAKEEGYLTGLSYLDNAIGVNPIVEKLPPPLISKWTSVGSKYKEETGVCFPPFFVFSRFVQKQAQIKNDPSFAFSYGNNLQTRPEKPSKYYGKTSVHAHKTSVPTETPHSQHSRQVSAIESPDRQCPIHHKPHPLKKCKGFRSKPIGERMYFLRQNSICFKCCESTNHMARDCKIPIECSECGSEKHIAALHPDSPPPPAETVEAVTDHSREHSDQSSSTVTAKCTEICGHGKSSRSCSKICLVTVFPKGQRDKAVRMYAAIDEQSNRSLATPEFFNIFNIKTTAAPYTLTTCAGVRETAGRRASNFMVESFDKKRQLSLPTLIECDRIPDDKEEIPSPEIAHHHPHLRPIANRIPAIDPKASIMLLLGRDILQVHKVFETINGPFNAPFAQRLELGWVIVGEVCLGSTHQTNSVNALRTSVLPNGRTTSLNPCQNRFIVKERFDNLMHFCDHSSSHSQEDISSISEIDNLGATIFQRSKDDDKQALSIEDQAFLQVMDKDTYQDDSHSWVAPLPFRSPRCSLPSNREQAMNRLISLRRSLQNKPRMKKDFTEFIQKMLDNEHAEIAGPMEQGKEHWYLPMFGVYHPHKPDQIRVVFDSSAECEGVSLNNVLLSGPDLNNTLLSVLMRFRKEPIAFTADVQQMFYCFLVREDHRDYLRFLWYKDHDLDKEIMEYRMRLHVFGNSPSPAVAIYCMRKAALTSAEQFGQDAKHFVLRHFYVDDGLASVSTPKLAIDTLNRTQQMLAESNLRLHKSASNSPEVMNAFPAGDRAKDLKDLCMGTDTLPLQKSLGLSWDLEKDSFVFQVSFEEKPFTRRGILSTVNSLYDPLGFVSPITLKGKALVRELSSKKCDWDEPLPKEKLHEWVQWKESLQALERLEIPRCYVSGSLQAVCKKELYIFSDASNTAIGAVAYLKTTDVCNKCYVGFVMGKSKLSPKPAHTIPRLELCAAVLAVELYELIRDELDVDLDAVRFFTDSKTVLGYICNDSRRFYLYVANRVNKIRRVTQPDQWSYVSTEQNPADYATRPTQSIHLQNSIWFLGPSFLYQTSMEDTSAKVEPYPLMESEADPEIKPVIASFSTKTSDTFIHPHVFDRFSSWMSLIKTIARRILDAMLLQDKPTRLTHEILSTFMAEVTAIMNARPLVPVSTDPDDPMVLTPAMLLTQKVNSLSAPTGNFETTGLHVKQWKQVQNLADTFWKRWKREYLSTLQSRRKWTQNRPNVKTGDVVLLKDSLDSRNDWPVGLVVNALPSGDGRVRKVEVKVAKQGTTKTYLRPISDVVVLVSENG